MSNHVDVTKNKTSKKVGSKLYLDAEGWHRRD